MAFNVRMSEETTVLRWTADAGSARSAALVMVRLCTVRQLRVAAPILFVVLTVVYAQGYDDTYSAATRWANAALNGAVYTAGFIVLGIVVTYVRMWRALRARLRPGSELTATWDDASVLFRQPLAEVRLPLVAIRRARRIGQWTGLQQRDTKAWSILPSSLVPDQEQARIGS